VHQNVQDLILQLGQFVVLQFVINDVNYRLFFIISSLFFGRMLTLVLILLVVLLFLDVVQVLFQNVVEALFLEKYVVLQFVFFVVFVAIIIIQSFFF
jgi:hypothetical protein